MSVETWEQIPKNQTNPELIEEAIARLIAVHEADPEAHTGENESLQAHRQNEIIDHPAGSVLADKMTSIEFNDYWDYSRLLASATKIGNMLDGTTHFNLYRNSVWYVESEVKITSPIEYNNYDLSRSFVIDMVVSYYLSASPDNSSAFYGLRFFTDDGVSECHEFNGTGFDFTNGVLTAKVSRCSDITDYTSYENLYTSDPITIISNEMTHFRILWNAFEKTFYFYVKGELVGQYILDTAFLDMGSIGKWLALYSPALTTTKTIIYGLYQINSTVSLFVG